MRRRAFVFGSLQAALFLSPILASRRARAQAAGAKRVLFWVNSSGYPDPEAFFPTGTEHDFSLGPILQPLMRLKDDMVIVDGVSLRDTGPNPKGNNHIRTVGKVLTAKDVLPVENPHDGEPGGISIDQLIARDLSLRSVEHLMDVRPEYNMRSKPFATGPRAFKNPIVETELLWDALFKDLHDSQASSEQRLAKLKARRSVLDGLTREMARFRRELDGIERLKLDVHEDAVRRAERSVLADIDASPPAGCACPERIVSTADIPQRGRTHFDLLFAAFVCNRVQVAGMKWSFSGYHWRYQWLDTVHCDTIHDDVQHRAVNRRQECIDAARWDWEQLGDFVQRLKSTPDGAGSMLDSSVVLGTSHFGKHHDAKRLPVVLLGKANGRLRTGRFLQLATPSYNDKLLTSIAHWMGAPIPGIGDDPTCGPLAELG